jgi:hypothetical protein
VEPAKIVPTWRNARKGRDGISKKLDRFLVVEDQLGVARVDERKVVILPHLGSNSTL